MSVPNIERDEMLTIGAVVAILNSEFPDARLTISKVRFLESEGLFKTIRTPTHYRKFTADVMDRLRYILAMQRDHFLPLKVIKEHLEQIDRGAEPVVLDSAPRIPDLEPRGVEVAEFETDSGLALTLNELADKTGVPVRRIVEFEKSGVIRRRFSDADHFGSDALVVVQLLRELENHGLDSRNLTTILRLAQNQVDIIQTRMKTVRAGGESVAEAVAEGDTMVKLFINLQSAFMQSKLARVQPS